MNETGKSEFTIKKMASIGGITEKTLRKYDAIGLLPPSRVDPDTGYRYYSSAQINTLYVIQCLKDTGLNLSEIKSILYNQDTSQMERSLEAQIRKLNQQKERLRAAERSLAAIKSASTMPCEVLIDQTFFLEHHDPRIYTEIDLGDLFVKQSPEDASFSRVDLEWAMCLKYIKELFMANDVPLSLFCNISAVIRKEDMLSGDMSIKYAAKFDEQLQSIGRIVTIPECLCLCVFCDCSSIEGVHGDNYYLIKMYEEIKKRGYVVAGDFIEEIIIDDLEGKKISKVQVPVEIC